MMQILSGARSVVSFCGCVHGKGLLSKPWLCLHPIQLSSEYVHKDRYESNLSCQLSQNIKIKKKREKSRNSIVLFELLIIPSRNHPGGVTKEQKNKTWWRLQSIHLGKTSRMDYRYNDFFVLRRKLGDARSLGRTLSSFIQEFREAHHPSLLCLVFRSTRAASSLTLMMVLKDAEDEEGKEDFSDRDGTEVSIPAGVPLAQQEGGGSVSVATALQ